MRGGEPIISNNTITSKFSGIVVGSSLPFGSSSAHISDNIISGCKVGIEVYGGSPIIEHNLIINNNGNTMGGEGGIRVDFDGTTPIIRNNTIVKNSVAFNILEYASPTIEFNNIYDNIEYSVYLYSGSGSDVNATYNWWGTTVTQAINQTIRDFKNDFNLGTVDFIPFLTELNPAAPTIPTFTIVASAGAGGSISPSGSVSVAYGYDQTFTVTPNSGYQIVSVLMDGVLATAPYTFFDVVADGHTISATFEQVPTPTPTPTPSPSPSPSPTPTPTPTPVSTQISISVDASSTAVGSAVNISGQLSDSNGNPLQDKSVTLSYAIVGDPSWVPIGSGTTNSAGEYSIQWVNTASGTFTLKAEWKGNDEYLGASSTTTLSFLPYENQQYFFVESNSTVTELAFNSTNWELSFTVNGIEGTAGYVKVTIAKSLVSNAENIKVYLDEKQLNYEVTSNADSWLLAFTYMHSTHQVTISLAASEPKSTLLSIESLALIVVVIGIAVAGVVGFIVWRKKKKT
jgi:parallel beta-helix repeat protein